MILGSRVKCLKTMEKNKKKIKVAIVINDFLVAGAQKLIVDMLMHADREKFEYVLVTLFLFSGKKTFYDKLPPYVMVHKLSWSGIRDLKGWRSLISLFREIRPQVVISHLFFTNTVTRLLKLFFDYRVITVEHNTYIKKTYFQILTDKLLSYFSYKIIAVSKTVAQFAAKQAHIPIDKFVVVYNGIDMNNILKIPHLDRRNEVKIELGFQQEDKIIINVGRLTDQKNQILLVEAFAVFVSKNPEYKLVILGEGAQKENLEGKIHNLKLNEKVFLMGARSDIFRFYMISEFLASSSKIEGLSIAYLEALAFGLPILATCTAGTDELVQEGYNGHLLLSNDLLSMISGLEYMHQAPLTALSKNAVISVERYDVKNTIRAYEKLCLASLD